MFNSAAAGIGLFMQSWMNIQLSYDIESHKKRSPFLHEIARKMAYAKMTGGTP